MNPRKRFQDMKGFQIRSSSNHDIVILDGSNIPYGECQTMLEIIRDTEKTIAKKDYQLLEERQAKAKIIEKVSALTSNIMSMNSVILKLEKCIEKSQEGLEIALGNEEEGHNVNKGFLDMVGEAVRYINKGQDVAKEWKSSVVFREVEALYFDETHEEENYLEEQLEEVGGEDVDNEDLELKPISFGVNVCVIS